MIRLSAWPQLSTAAAFVTAVAVVLNPVTPVLPDITVPALFPPANGRPSPMAARPASPPAAIPAPPTVPSPAAPAVATVAAAALPDPAMRWQPAVPADLPAPIAARDLTEPAVEIAALPKELPTALLPSALPVIRIDDPPTAMTHAGDRPRSAGSQQPVAPVGANRPLPAAAVDSPGAPPTGGSPDGGVHAGARSGPAGPGPTDALTRGHRGPATGD